MKTLIFQLYGPMQSWGTTSRFEVRSTDKYPSKSAICGFVCAAKGISKDPEFIAKFNDLKFGVRIDWPGELMTDYQIVAGDPYAATLVRKESGKYKKEYVSFSKDIGNGIRGRDGLQTYREYLTNAFFTIGLQGDEKFLLDIAESIKNPCWFLYLGRKCCPLGLPVVPEIKDSNLITALSNYQFYENPYSSGESELRMFVDGSTGELKNDVRIGGEINNNKKYSSRFVKYLSCPTPSERKTLSCI